MRTTHCLLLVLSLSLLGCPPPGVDDTGPEGDADTDADGDTDTDTDVGELSGLDWRLHEEIESLVYVSWEQDGTGTIQVEYSFDDGEWLTSPALEAGPGVHEQLLLGIPYGTDAAWRVVVEEGASAEGETITTGALPQGMRIPTVQVNEPTLQLAEGRYLLTSLNVDGGWSTGDFWTFIVDRQGRPVWAQLAPRRNWTLFAQVAASGDHILWDEATAWSSWDSGRASKVHRTWLDEEIDTIATPGLHHAFVQLPDGTLVWGSQAHGGGEALVEKAPGEDQETIIWTCAEDWVTGGHCESNGLFYRASTDSFLYSFYTNSSVVEVDHGTGESIWWAGQARDGYDFSPQDASFDWQHGVSWTDAGTLLVSTDARSSGGGGGGGRWTTQAVEYEVDHDARTLTRIWSFDSGYSAGTNGDAWRLDNGNTLHLVGAAGHIFEVTAEGETAWHLDFGGKRLLGRGELIEDLYTLVQDQGRDTAP
jgi:hypothetical protein